MTSRLPYRTPDSGRSDRTGRPRARDHYIAPILLGCLPVGPLVALEIPRSEKRLGRLTTGLVEHLGAVLREIELGGGHALGRDRNRRHERAVLDVHPVV